MKFYVRFRGTDPKTERTYIRREVVQIPPMAGKLQQPYIQKLLEFHYAIFIMANWQVDFDIWPVQQYSDLIGYN